MVGKSTPLISLKEEIEGDCVGTVDFVFFRIGDPIPLKPSHCDSSFDLSNPPSQPLAVSERHHLLFLAHSEGFLVANTKNVVKLAKGTRGKDTCVQESCVVNVLIGRVSILALSGDSTMLSATVGGEIRLYFVPSLLIKAQDPAITFSLNNSGIVKELKWQKNLADSFIVLSSDGILFHGSSNTQLKDVMDKVDAVDWCVDGNFVAIARKNTVSILSPNFEEKLEIQLLSQSWTSEFGSEIKVDSVKWFRHDSIVIGCTHSKVDVDEDGYLVQVIISGEHKFTEASCKPVIFSFSDLFEGLAIDMLPSGVGPYFLADYLDCWNVAIASNKKNIDQHISLLRWLVEDNRYEVVSLEFGSDKYLPRIDLQDGGDDNLILGLAVDKSSLCENIKIQQDTEFVELSPRCILLCLTCDGKLTLYHTAWISEPSDLPNMTSLHDDKFVNERFHTESSSELGVTTSGLKDGLNAGDKLGSCQTLDSEESYSQGSCMMISSYSRSSATEWPRMPSNAKDFSTNSANNVLAIDSLMVKRNGDKEIHGSAIAVGSLSQKAQKPVEVLFSNASASSTVKETVTSRIIGSNANNGSSSWSLTAMPLAADTAGAKHFYSSHGESNSNIPENTVLFFPPSNPSANFSTLRKPFGTPASSENINQTGVPVSFTKSEFTGPTSILPSSSVGSLPQTAQKPVEVVLSNASASSTVKETVASIIFGSNTNNGSSWFQTTMHLASDTAGAKHFFSSPSESNSTMPENTVVFSPPNNPPANFPTLRKPFGTPTSSEKVNQTSAPVSFTKSGFTGRASILPSSSEAASAKLSGSKQQPLIANSAFSKPRPRLDSEPQFSKQSYNVKDMAKELDALLYSIEYEGGFKDLCTVFQEQSLLVLEAGLYDLSEVLNYYGDKNENQLIKVQQLCNKMSEVSARLVSLKSLLQRASDHRYRDIWNSQKLSSEFEAKWLRISILKQNLRNQLIELERHFHSLEINKFAGGETPTTGWRAPCNSALLRQTRSFHSVYNTVNSQLAAAEQLSKCLSQQMGMLNINSPTSEKQNVTRKLFETIGLDSKTDAFKSRDYKTSKSAPSAVKTFKLESSRRKKDSLEKSWVHFEPSKTTVKRTSKKEQVRSNLDVAFRDAKDVFDSQLKAFDIAQKATSETLDSPIQVPGITKRTSFMSNTTFINPPPFLELSPSKGFVEKESSKEAIEAPSKSLFKFPKEPSVLRSEPNTGSSSSIPCLFPAAGTQPFSFPAQWMNSGEKSTLPPSMNRDEKSLQFSFSAPSMNKDEKSASPLSFPAALMNKAEKFASPFTPNPGASSTLNISASAASKTPLITKPQSDSSTAYSGSTSSQSNKGISSIINEADVPTSPSQQSPENPTIPSSTFSTSSAASPTSSSLSSFQFRKSMPPPKIFSSSSNKSDDPPSSSSELSSKPLQPAPVLSSYENSLSSNKTKDAILVSESPPVSLSNMFPLKSQGNLNPCSSINVEPTDDDTDNSKLPASSDPSKDESIDAILSQEDAMEEETLDAASHPALSLESLSSFALQLSAPSSNVQKPNPFGSSFSAAGANPALSWSASPGQLFRPPSFSLPASQPPQLSGSNLSAGGLTGVFSGFGQPAQLGAGQQALGSVLGSFGQSRQLGDGAPGLGFASSNIGFAGAASGGGFAGAATGSGFAGISTGAGFVSAATGGGFAGATTGGGFAGATTGGGFAGAATGGGFAGVAAGGGFSAAGAAGGSGFGGANSMGGFGSFGGRPPAELFTQMRK